MSELKGACVIGQSGGPTSVINSSVLGALEAALDNPSITPQEFDEKMTGFF